MLAMANACQPTCCQENHRSSIICLNGAAAHLCQPGDFAIATAYEESDRAVRTGHSGRVAIADERNRCKKCFSQILDPCQGKLLFHFETTVHRSRVCLTRWHTGSQRHPSKILWANKTL